MTNWEWPQWVMVMWFALVLWAISQPSERKHANWVMVVTFIFSIILPNITLYFGGFWK